MIARRPAPFVAATVIAAALGVVSVAVAQPAVSPGVPGARTGSDKSLDQAPKRVPGYLKPAQYPDTYVVLSAPPTPKSRELAEQVDREAYLSTRKLQGHPRWNLAARDADESAAAVAADYDCALGFDLSPETAPKTLTLLTRVRTDAGFITTPTKNRFQHPRPFVTYGGAICTENDRAGLAKSWSYPSGHTTMGWAYGLLLAELAPDRATDILARSRAYGESRVVCGVHTVSDIQEGRTNASALVAALHADPVFRADLEAARTEMAILRARGGQVPAYRQCAVEKDASWETPWLKTKPPEPSPVSPTMAAEAKAKAKK